MRETSINPIHKGWKNFSVKHPFVTQFVVFFAVSNGVTLIQIILMPIIKYFLGMTSLVDVNIQVLRCGSINGNPYYIFDYPAGSIATGGGGGMAYFLAVEITILVAQIINFFLQRNVTFKSQSNIFKAAFWYMIAYIIITIGAASAQSFYKDPIYNLLQSLMGSLGIVLADIVTMIINCTISFWIFFPIFKVIFKDESKKEEKEDA